jgi:hypothetical protein
MPCTPNHITFDNRALTSKTSHGSTETSISSQRSWAFRSLHLFLEGLVVVTEIGVETWVEEDEDRTCGIRSAFSYLGSSLRLVDGCVSGSSKESNSVSILHPLTSCVPSHINPTEYSITAQFTEGDAAYEWIILFLVLIILILHTSELMSPHRPMLKCGSRPENFAFLPSRLYENGASNPTIRVLSRPGQLYPLSSPLIRFAQSGTTSLLSAIPRKVHPCT